MDTDSVKIKRWEEISKLATSFKMRISIGAGCFFVEIERMSMGQEKYLDNLGKFNTLDELSAFVKGYSDGIRTARLEKAKE